MSKSNDNSASDPALAKIDPDTLDTDPPQTERIEVVMHRGEWAGDDNTDPTYRGE